jgi:hypothetical protein
LNDTGSELDLEPGACDPESGYPTYPSDILSYPHDILLHIHKISLQYPSYPGISCFNIHTFGFLVCTIGFLGSTIRYVMDDQRITMNLTISENVRPIDIKGLHKDIMG